jgi:chromosome segregation ATPase
MTQEEFDSDSPRTALLSPSSSNHDHQTSQYNPIDHLVQRRHRGPSDRFRRERERAYSSRTTRDLLSLLINEEYEAKQTRKLLYAAMGRLEAEAHRAVEAERRVSETSERFRGIAGKMVGAREEARRMREELSLYKMQLEAAQREIFRAQDVLKAVEGERDEAELNAAEARTRVRRMNEERQVEFAREEGRRLGFEEGMRRGREIGFNEGREIGYGDGEFAEEDALEGGMQDDFDDESRTQVQRSPSITNSLVNRPPEPPLANRMPTRVRRPRHLRAGCRSLRLGARRLHGLRRGGTR